VPLVVSSNGVIAVILHYFTEFGSFVVEDRPMQSATGIVHVLQA